MVSSVVRAVMHKTNIFVYSWLSVFMHFFLIFFFIFLSKLDLVFVVNDHVLECHAKKLGLYLQGQGHSEGL